MTVARTWILLTMVGLYCVASETEHDICKDVNVEKGVKPCKCKSGYAWNGYQCEPTKDCGTYNGGCVENSNCINTEEGFARCTCKNLDQEDCKGPWYYKLGPQGQGICPEDSYKVTNFTECKYASSYFDNTEKHSHNGKTLWNIGEVIEIPIDGCFMQYSEEKKDYLRPLWFNSHQKPDESLGYTLICSYQCHDSLGETVCKNKLKENPDMCKNQWNKSACQMTCRSCDFNPNPDGLKEPHQQ